jgi:hypothetical protein
MSNFGLKRFTKSGMLHGGRWGEGGWGRARDERARPWSAYSCQRGCFVDNPKHTAMVLALDMAWTIVCSLCMRSEEFVARFRWLGGDAVDGGMVLNAGAVARPKLGLMRLRCPKASTSLPPSPARLHLSFCVEVMRVWVVVVGGGDFIPKCTAHRAFIQILILTAVENTVINAYMYLLHLQS